MKSRPWTILPCFAALISVSGCASIMDGSQQTLSVRTVSGWKQVAGAQCMVDNNKGTWYVTTPGTVTVHRSYDPLNVVCHKAGYEGGITSVASSTKGMEFGNIIFGDLIGAEVDMGTGAAYDYPGLISVSMGDPDTASRTEAGQPTS
jgi:hypothetical protein